MADAVEKVDQLGRVRNYRIEAEGFLNHITLSVGLLNQCCALDAANSFFDSIEPQQTLPEEHAWL
jgi:hypothetical protein